jgi:hypothetical protein
MSREDEPSWLGKNSNIEAGPRRTGGSYRQARIEDDLWESFSVDIELHPSVFKPFLSTKQIGDYIDCWH